MSKVIGTKLGNQPEIGTMREEAEKEVEAEEADEPSISMTMQHRDIMYCLERRFRDKFTLYE